MSITTVRTVGDASAQAALESETELKLRLIGWQQQQRPDRLESDDADQAPDADWEELAAEGRRPDTGWLCGRTLSRFPGDPGVRRGCVLLEQVAVSAVGAALEACGKWRIGESRFCALREGEVVDVGGRDQDTQGRRARLGGVRAQGGGGSGRTCARC